MKRITILLFALLLACTTTIYAQSKMPSHQFGLGLYADPAGTGLGLPGGVSLTYAISHDMQVGSALGLDIVSGGAKFAFAPFFRYLFSGNVNPYLQGAFGLVARPGTTDAGFLLGGGLAYGVSQNFMLNLNLNLLTAVFTNGGGVEFSFSNVSAGGSWFF